MTNPQLYDAIWTTIAQEERMREQYRASATEQLAKRVGDIHRQYPFLQPGVKLAAAKGELSDEQIAAIAKTGVVPSVDTRGQQAKKHQTLGDKFRSALKTGSRYSFAGLNFIPQFVQGGVAQMFDKNDDVGGWFISTDLGSMIANGDESGTGLFMGGRAKSLQEERARRYRGEIDGHAFTIGRGLATTFLKEDTIPYRVLSGAIDAGVTIGADPFSIIGRAGKVARALDEAGEAGTVLSKFANASRYVGRGSKEIGITKLTKAEREALKAEAGLVHNSVDFGKANRFFTTGFGRRIVDRTAQTTDFAETWDLWGKKLDPATVMRLTKADTPEKVMGELLDVLGTEITDTSNIIGGRRYYTSLAQRDELLRNIPGGKQVSRAWSKIPRKSINLSQAETPREQIQQIDTLDRTLKLFKSDPEVRRNFINRAGELLVNPNDAKITSFYDDLELEAKDALVRGGSHRAIVDAVHDGMKYYKEKVSMFAADELGNATDYGLYNKVKGLPDDAAGENFVSGTLASELATREFHVPDVRQFRRLTNQYNWLWVKKDPNIDALRNAGQLRLPFRAVEFVQENVWRKLIVATLGNFVRNTIDSQLSIWMSGKANPANPFFHPFQWWEFATSKSGKGDLLNQDWNVLGAAGVLDDAQQAHRIATSDMVSAVYKDPLATQRRAARLNIFKQYERHADEVSTDVARAHGDELGKLNASWDTRMMAQGKTIDEIMQMIKDGDPDAMRWYRTMKTSWDNGQPVYNRVARTTSYESIDLSVDQNLRNLLETNQQRLSTVTGDHPELLDVVGLGMLKNSTEEINVRNLRGNIEVGGRVEVRDIRNVDGKKIRTTYLGRVEEIIETDSGAVKAVISPYAFDGYGDNSVALERLLHDERIYMDPRMPRYQVGEIRDPRSPAADLLRNSMDTLMNKFYTYLYNKPISTLERSPMFRSQYYDWVGKLAPSMDEAGLNTIIRNIENSHAEPAKYLGEELWAKLKDLQANPQKLYGTLTPEEVSSHAAGAALDEYQKIVYNAVERRNGTDVMRAISPFGQQWAEFIGRMARFATAPVAGGELGYLPNAKNLRKMQLLWEGGKDFDPDGDGRGFIFKDQGTGQWSFAIPLTGPLAKMFTGMNAGIVASVKGIAMGLDVRPGLGPFATMAMSAITPDSPNFDFVRKMTMPYGERTNLTDALAPSWVRKIYDGVTGNTNGKYFATTYAEVMQALAATGDYDLSIPDQRDKMLQDAKDKARYLVVLRGVSQFTGPASGTIDLKVSTKAGDVHVDNLAKALRSLQEINYDTAALRFIEIFGEDAFTYLGNKTVSEAGGLETSAEFGKFERTNQSLFRQYKDVAGYFGPVGTSMDFEVFSRQVQTGLRKKLTAEELLAASERSIGMAYYKDMREHLGPNINQQERAYLQQYRTKIEDKYPGFKEMAYDPNKTDRAISKLFEAAQRTDLENNPVAKGVRYYEQIRNAALMEANRRGYASLKSDKLSDLHEYLNSYADAISTKYPEFARVFDRLLSLEID